MRRRTQDGDDVRHISAAATTERTKWLELTDGGHAQVNAGMVQAIVDGAGSVVFAIYLEIC